MCLLQLSFTSHRNKKGIKSPQLVVFRNILSGKLPQPSPTKPNARVLSRNLRQTEHPFLQSKSDVIIALARTHAQIGKIP